jgi:hypothetical protein
VAVRDLAVMIRIGQHAAFASAIHPFLQFGGRPDGYVSHRRRAFFDPMSGTIAPELRGHPDITPAVYHPEF